MKFFRPILPSSRYVPGNRIDADKNGIPLLEEQLFLLNCSLSEDKIRSEYPTLWKYLENGREEMKNRYLCKSRTIWYKQESRAPAPFLCTYMGRPNSKH